MCSFSLYIKLTVFMSGLCHVQSVTETLWRQRPASLFDMLNCQKHNGGHFWKGGKRTHTYVAPPGSDWNDFYQDGYYFSNCVCVSFWAAQYDVHWHQYFSAPHQIICSICFCSKDAARCFFFFFFWTNFPHMEERYVSQAIRNLPQILLGPQNANWLNNMKRLKSHKLTQQNKEQHWRSLLTSH